MKRLVIGVLVGLMVGATGAPAGEHASEAREWKTSFAATIQPGQMIRWQSPRIGPVSRERLVANGEPMNYGLKPRTNNCVAFGYGEGVAVRVTDCEAGKRIPFVRIRAVNAGVKPVRLKLRFGN